MNKLYIKKLRCEYKSNPIGIDILKPRFSWQLDSSIRGCIQEAYQLQVSKENVSFDNIVWDSSRVISDQSVHVEYDGHHLQSTTRYYYRIKVWDTKGNESLWSEVAFFETGFFSNEEWEAKWISSPELVEGNETEKCPLLGKAFDLKGSVRSARIYTSALGLYDLYLNGKKVSEDLFTPGWTNYKKWVQYQTYDVTSLLRYGSNVIGAILGKGWYKGNMGFEGKSGRYGEHLALILQMHIYYEDDTNEVISTDEDWKTTFGPILMSEIYHGETYDARFEIPGWNEVGYTLEGWRTAVMLDKPKSTLRAQVGVPVRRISEIKPVSLITTPKGEKVLDFGQNMVGWVRFSVKGKSGEEVVLHHGEILDGEGNFYFDNLRSAKQTIHYTLNGQGIEIFEPHFTFQGFRYVKVDAYPDTLDINCFTGIVIHSDMEETGSFQCSNPMINQLQHNILWSQKGNFLDVPTDCPQRDERLGWTGDAQVFIRTACFNMNVAPFFTKWLYDLKSEQSENGGIPFIIPHILSDEPHSSSGWGDAATICPWTLYLCYGDKRILEEQYESMKAWVEYIKKQGDIETLWNTGFHFGDWLALDAMDGSYVGATANDYIATAFYAYSTELLSKIAGILKKHEDEKYYTNLNQKILTDFRKEFVTPSGRLAVPTQTAYVLALMFNLVEDKDRERVITDLVADLKENNIHLKTGFIGTPYICEVLSSNGYLDVAYKLLLQKDYPSWLYQIDKGATTVWEHWDSIKADGSFWSTDMNSFNHYAYGAVGDWLYRVIGGLNTSEDQPGYKHNYICPKPYPESGINSVDACLETMHGSLKSSWEIERSMFHLSVTIPANTVSTVLLPGARVEQVKADGMDLRDNNNIHLFTQKVTGVEINIGSGLYQFSYPVNEIMI